MADFVDRLTDAELRSKLAEYGFPVVPITATTRKLMVKKLKMLIENKNKINSEGRKSLAKYSSGEESESDSKVDTKSKERNRRATVAGSMLPPLLTKSKKADAKRNVTNENANNVDSKSISKSESKNVTETTTTTRRYRRTQYADDDNEYSDSDLEIIEQKSPPSPDKTSNSRRSPPSPPDFTEPETDWTDTPPRTSYYSPLSNLRTGAATSSVPTFGRASGLRSSGLNNTSTFASNTKTIPTSSTSSTSNLGNRSIGVSSTALDNLNQIRSRLSLGSTPLIDRRTSSIYDRKNVSSNSETNVETPYFSEFTRRLSQISKKRTDDYDTKNDIIKENDLNGSQQYSRTFSRYNTDRNNFDVSKEFKKSQEKNIFKNNVVSFTLLGIVCLFFLAISFLYMGMKSDQVPLLDVDLNNLPYCELSNIEEILRKPSVNCVKRDSVKPALALLKILQPELMKRSVNFKCDKSKSAPHMTESAIIEYTQKIRPDINQYDIREDLYNLQFILLNKPELGISVINIKNIYETNFDEPPLSDIDIFIERPLKNLALVIKNPELPLRCLLFSRLYTIIWYAVILIAGALIVYGVQYGVKYFLKMNREKNRKIYEMVEQIIDVLSRHAANGENGENYMAISHVRDIIIPVQDRQKMNSIWSAAVKFLENNESRVRTEVQIVSGEEYPVWRWLGNSALNLSGNRSKVWQGQAFDTTQEGSVNSLPISPTQCLKIRHMIDKNDTTGNWSQVIMDAILEKCGENCKILHIGIDKATCCVYVKCASSKDAGIAYRNLHGWWYDGKLITVKYLRLERYLERFPDSPSSGPYLKPSNNKKLSLQNDWSTNNEDIE